MKYNYNRKIKDVVLVTDDKERLESSMTNFILNLLEINGLAPIAVKHFDGRQVQLNNTSYFRRDRKIFRKSFDYLTDPISVNTLIAFSRQRPELQRSLREEPLSIMEILWKEYKRRFHRPDSLHEIVEHYEIGQKFAGRFPDAHILVVLFHHKVISPKLHGNGTLNYHSIGRGFYGYGCCKPIDPEIGSPGRAKISISVKAVSECALEKKKAFARQIFLHEYWGHTVNNLDDHFAIPMKKCIMSVSPSLKSFIKSAQNPNRRCFCEDCLNEIHYLPETLNKQ